MPNEPSTQKKHCDHECVCAVLAVGEIEEDRTPCNFSGCRYDTRITPQVSEDANSGEFSFGVSTPCRIFTLEALQRHDNDIACSAEEKGKREAQQALFVSDRTSDGRGALYSRPDEPSSISGVVIGDKEYQFDVTLTRHIKAVEITVAHGRGQQ